MKNPDKLTQWSKSSGCGCKIDASRLHQIIESVKTPQIIDPQLIIGSEHADDAVVYALNDREALVSTTDFFTSVVDDPQSFGKIAAANALSDVYAMGANPMVALSILGWPTEYLGVERAKQVLQGAQEQCRLAGILIAGGHSIETSEPFFGLMVNGRIQRANICYNHTLKDGDQLILTKALGSGIYAKAFKSEGLLEPHYSEWLHQMIQLNEIGSVLAQHQLVHAMTDITGFGLGGHMLEMLKPKGFSAEISIQQIPVLPMFNEYASRYGYPDALFKNWNAIKSFVNTVHKTPSSDVFAKLSDPQTSGGLLCSVAPEKINLFKDLCQKHQQAFWIIGRVFRSEEVKISVID